MTDDATDVGYRSGTWRGAPHYECSSCIYDSFSEADMQGHVLEHQPKVAPETAAAQPSTATTVPEAAPLPATVPATAPATPPTVQPVHHADGNKEKP